jgi:hypothetical protein
VLFFCFVFLVCFSSRTSCFCPGCPETVILLAPFS